MDFLHDKHPAPPPEPPQATFQAPDTVALSGRWLRTLPRPDARPILDAIPAGTLIRFDASRLLRWDTTLLVFLRKLQENGHALDVQTLPEGLAKLMALSAGQSNAAATATAKDGFLVRTGLAGISIFNTFLHVAEFTGEVASAIGSLLIARTRMRWNDLRQQLFICGPQALGIICLISYLMGLILAFIGAIPLQWFQVENYVASLVGIGMLRLMAPVMVGIVMAGRTGAAHAAELGTMQVNEEIDALQTLGVPPIQFLVLPRCLAMSILQPMLCVFADGVSILGGLTVAVFHLKITPLAYFHTLVTTTRVSDFLVGLFTAWVLGTLDGLCGCYHGIRCGRSAAAVGRATTDAVVYSIICTVIATSLITVLSVVLAI